MIVVRLIAWSLVIVAILAAYRQVAKRSPQTARIVAAGIILRAAAGIALFVISLFELPVMQSLQSGGGFWRLAIDARYYFTAAAQATYYGVDTVAWSEPSPAFVRALTVWMQTVGLSPASGILFNLLCYVGLTSIIVAAGAPRRVEAVAIAAVTVSPALFIFGTQPLKDPFCLLLIAVAFGSLRLWFDGVEQVEPRALVSASVGLVGASLAVYLVGGVRPYVGAMILVGTVVAIATAAAAAAGPSARLRSAACSAGLLVVLTGAFVYGTGLYFGYYESLVRRAFSAESTPLAALDSARAGFDAAGGATSVREAPAAAPAEGIDGLELGSVSGPGMAIRLVRLGRGLLIMFVPISLLRAVDLVNFSGGRGLLFLTDIDTLVNDLALAACLYFVLARYRPRRWSLFVAVAMFAVLMTCALAYVVTNFGTLFRLRLMASAPVWLLPVLVRLGPRHVDAPPPVEQI